MKTIFLKNVLTCIAAIHFTGVTISAQKNSDLDFIENHLEDYIDEALEMWKVPGLALAIIKDGETKVLKGYGKIKNDGDEKVNPNTLFLIGSTTKAFTSALLADLAQKNSLNLDDKVVKWLPQFSMSDDWITNQVTIQDLLSHKFGLSKFQGDFIYFDSTLSKEDIFSIVQKLPITEPFRSFNYTNVGYFFAAEVIEKITASSWEDQLHKVIFNPLKMSRTLAVPSKFVQAENRAFPHSTKKGEIVFEEIGNTDLLKASGGISSSASDLSNWVTTLLDEGEFNGESVISNKVIQSVLEPKIFIGRTGMPYAMFNKTHFENYASGWYNLDYNGTEIVTHNGGMYGFAASITLVPEHKLGIVILTNSDSHLLFETLKLEILDAYLGLPFRNYSSIGHTFFEKQTKKKEEREKEIIEIMNEGDKVTPNLVAYAGTYNNPIYGKIELTKSEDMLIMKFEHHPKLEGYLRHIKGDNFLNTFNKRVYGSEILSFEKLESGELTFNFNVDPNVEPNSYVFIKIDP